MADKEISIKYYVTYDYEKFIKHQKNRSINENNVIRLIESLKIRNLMIYHPVIVDKNFIVLDGHHRVEACKREDLPIIYIIIDDQDDVDAMILLNVQRSWTIPDRVNYKSASGSSSYMRIQKFAEQSKLTVSAVLQLLNRGGRINSGVQLGEDLDVSRLDYFQTLIPKVDEILDMLKDMHIPDPKKKLTPLHERISFRESLFILLKDDRIDLDRLKSKLTQYLKHITISENKHGYLKAMRDIYNLGQKKDILQF
jgi:hypothetical protein